ncbi:MAG: glycoside hydrolase family 2 [Pseudopedobacter saltans]|uniref:Glycoside hydrolase family 2 n=1 Tax=Pseudopedobacter saltans TaxID=151895 RepID=A0A2W5EMR9_9SPHI|nr:MAG: glycoside hydrolase family 2 [Pseudopedobacter saltans]
MKRRNFITQASILTTGSLMFQRFSWAKYNKETLALGPKLYDTFNEPLNIHRPFVRWWWNGDKIEKKEILRELKLLKNAGIGGIEINPIKFPQRTDDLNIKSLQWLGDEWIDVLDFTLTEAKKLDLTCDLIVGSGWPFGAEYLSGDECADIMTIAVKKVSGIMDLEIPLLDLIKEADPATTSPFARRKIEIKKVFLVPDPMDSLDQIVDLSNQIPSGYIKTAIPIGNYTLYALVQTKTFLEVINGAPGANGQVLNHFNKTAVEKYLNHMSDSIQNKIGPLKGRLRAMFIDSMELEGANWTKDMPIEFQKRRGYDLMPYLPLILNKIGGMGNIYNYNYGTAYTDQFKDTIERVRCDFDRTKVELLKERFVDTFQNWCGKLGLLSRVQSYGRGYHPLEGSLKMDIPEGETWIKYGVGENLPESDYRIGRGYSMVNKFVSSAAHLTGKRIVSCEECTNTDMVFNTTLQMIKLASDQSLISGITHSVYHGFNYSPPNAPFPGWIRYGNYMSEHNTYWPFFKLLNDYKGRISALLQSLDMYTDIAIMPPIYDAWSKYGAQNEPFPSLTYPTNLSLIWESIQQNGNTADYISDFIINNSIVKDGKLCYGPKQYQYLFLDQVESLEPMTATKILEFVKAGGKVFAIQFQPTKSVGLFNAKEENKVIENILSELKSSQNSFYYIENPDSNYPNWYKKIQKTYKITPYVTIQGGNPFIQQVRYHDKNMEVLMIFNSSYNNNYEVKILPHSSIYNNKYGYCWDPTNGKRYELPDMQDITVNLYPADMRIFVFESQKQKNVPLYHDIDKKAGKSISSPWNLTFNGIDNSIDKTILPELKDLKLTEFKNFAGNVIYKNTIHIDSNIKYLDLGVVHGISHVKVNGTDMGIRWYGRHIYSIHDALKIGNNSIEITITTTMGNYLRTLKDNPIAQYWTIGKKVPQPIVSMGLIGPVTYF